MEDYAIIILAAGSSSRMNQPKQLLQVNGKTLLRHTIDEALALLPSSVYVVTGANAERITTELDLSSVQICHNPDWQKGMSSSIRSGLQALLHRQPAVSGCIISVCDQPLISTAIFEALISIHRTASSRIVASEYRGTTGVPALFGKEFFPELMQLSGQEGAKKLLKIHHQHVVSVPFSGGEIDIDTPADYHKLHSFGPL